MKVRWLLKAYSDLQNIRDFIALDSPFTADKFVTELYDSVNDLLIKFPRLGRIIPELDNPLMRELIHGSYRVMYEVKTDFVEVQTVIHSKRLFPSDY